MASKTSGIHVSYRRTVPLLCMLLFAILTGCYRPHLLIDNTAPTFTVNMDTVIVREVKDSYAFDVAALFLRTAGNPSNYPITCYLSDLPAGFVPAQDTFHFRLTYFLTTKVLANSGQGTYTFNLCVKTPDSAIRKYPVHIKVLP
ncbi:MAG: hypothetical protein V4649_08370 [Bacteroidota bacterium]